MVFACLAAAAATDMRAEGSRQLEEVKGVDFYFFSAVSVCLFALSDTEQWSK